MNTKQNRLTPSAANAYCSMRFCMRDARSRVSRLRYTRTVIMPASTSTAAMHRFAMPGRENSAASPRQPSSLRKSAKTVASEETIASPFSGLNTNEPAAPTPLSNSRG